VQPLEFYQLWKEAPGKKRGHIVGLILKVHPENLQVSIKYHGFSESGMPYGQ
jgi:hypothetical protein